MNECIQNFKKFSISRTHCKEFPATPSHDSDSDFEDNPQQGIKQKCLHAHNKCREDKIDNKQPVYLQWDQLPADMQSVFPPDANYTYVIQSHTVQETKQFDGAPFSATVRINLEKPEVNTWLDKMMESSCCTYRVSRGVHKPAGRRVLCKHKMHCQHYRKPLTRIQVQRRYQQFTMS